MRKIIIIILICMLCVTSFPVTKSIVTSNGVANPTKQSSDMIPTLSHSKLNYFNPLPGLLSVNFYDISTHEELYVDYNYKKKTAYISKDSGLSDHEMININVSFNVSGYIVQKASSVRYWGNRSIYLDDQKLVGELYLKINDKLELLTGDSNGHLGRTLNLLPGIHYLSVIYLAHEETSDLTVWDNLTIYIDTIENPARLNNTLKLIPTTAEMTMTINASPVTLNYSLIKPSVRWLENPVTGNSYWSQNRTNLELMTSVASYSPAENKLVSNISFYQYGTNDIQSDSDIEDINTAPSILLLITTNKITRLISGQNNIEISIQNGSNYFSIVNFIPIGRWFAEIPNFGDVKPNGISDFQQISNIDEVDGSIDYLAINNNILIRISGINDPVIIESSSSKNNLDLSLVILVLAIKIMKNIIIRNREKERRSWLI